MARAATRLPHCRLFLILPAGLEPESGKKLIAAAFGAGDVASLLIRAGPLQLRTAEIAKPLSHAHDVALLLEDNTQLAGRLGADGVQLAADPSAYVAARAALGENAIIGVDCTASRHLAMTFGELGADYIGFSQVEPGSPSIIGWWSELFELPCVALDPAEAEEAHRLKSEGADFLRPSDAMWVNEQTAAAAVRNYNAILGNLK